MASGLYHADNATPQVRQVAQSFGFQKVTGRMIDKVCEQRRYRLDQKRPIAQPSCGPGTVRDDNGVCVLSSTACGDGTRLENGKCVLDVHDHPCDEGTRWHIATGKCHVDCGLFGTWDPARHACTPSDGNGA